MAPAIISVRIRSRLEEDTVEETSDLDTMPEPFNHVVPLSAMNRLNTLVGSGNFQDYLHAFLGVDNRLGHGLKRRLRLLRKYLRTKGIA